MDQEKFKNLIDLIDYATDVFQHGGSYTASFGPYGQGLTVEPAALKPNPLPWLLVGGLGLTLLLVVVMGD